MALTVRDITAKKNSFHINKQSEQVNERTEEKFIYNFVFKYVCCWISELNVLFDILFSFAFTCLLGV